MPQCSVRRTYRHVATAVSQYRAFAQSTPRPREIIFSGIQPTGVPHLGNWLGALQPWLRLQQSSPPSTKLIFSIVDLHALTVHQDAEQLRQWKRETLATLLAVGLDPERCTIFYQSAVPAHTELMWILSCTASMGFLSRMTQWKSKLALPEESLPSDVEAKAKLKLGLFSYPVLQAADILLYRATQVPVGEDQVQHIEFARECARNFGSLYGPILVEPHATLSTAKRVMSLREPRLKMSKSHQDPRSRILLTDMPEVIRMKIRVALTDSVNGISYDLDRRPGVSNLLAILSYLDGSARSCHDLAREYSELSMRELKEKVSDQISKAMADIRMKYDQVMNADDGRYLASVANAGAKKAREDAEETMVKVRMATGLY